MINFRHSVQIRSAEFAIFLTLWFIVAISLTSCGEAEPLPVIFEPSQTPSATPLPQAVGINFVTLAPPTAVIDQTTPTPFPTATVTPTPTPVVYLIQDGDTLLGIAYERGTTTDAILELNPDVRPELLSIGQQIILPQPATPVFSADAATPIPLDIEFLSLSTYKMPNGGLWVLGEAVNRSAGYVTDAEIEISWQQSEGNVAWVRRIWLPVRILSPQARTPFGINVPDAADLDGQPILSIVSGNVRSEPPGDSDSLYLDLEPSNIEWTQPDGEIITQFEILNVGEQTAVDLQLLIVYYDNQNNVSGYTLQRSDGPLMSRASQTYVLRGAPPGRTVSSVAVIVQALRE